MPVPKSCSFSTRVYYGLPPNITANTGMDALTHAVEAYLGILGTAFTDQKAMDACSLIFDNF